LAVGLLAAQDVGDDHQDRVGDRDRGLACPRRPLSRASWLAR
jgi:hypothetical protein